MADQDHELVPGARLELQEAGLGLRGRLGLGIRDHRDRQSRRVPANVGPVHGARCGRAAGDEVADESENDDDLAHGACLRARNAAVG